MCKSLLRIALLALLIGLAGCGTTGSTATSEPSPTLPAPAAPSALPPTATPEPSPTLPAPAAPSPQPTATTPLPPASVPPGMSWLLLGGRTLVAALPDGPGWALPETYLTGTSEVYGAEGAKTVRFPSNFAFTPDGKAMLFAIESRIESFDLATGQRQVLFADPPLKIGAFVISPDGRQICFFSGESASGTSATGDEQLETIDGWSLQVFDLDQRQIKRLPERTTTTIKATESEVKLFWALTPPSST